MDSHSCLHFQMTKCFQILLFFFLEITFETVALPGANYTEAIPWFILADIGCGFIIVGYLPDSDVYGSLRRCVILSNKLCEETVSFRG